MRHLPSQAAGLGKLCGAFGALILGGLLAWPLSAQESAKKTATPTNRAKKAAIPTKKELGKAEALLREVFRDAYAAKATDNSEAYKEAAQLLWKAARDTQDDLPIQFVLYRDARDLAARAGDGSFVLQIIDDMTEDFVFDTLEMKTALLAQAGKSAPTREAYRTVAELALQLFSDALDTDQYDLALRLAKTADEAARGGKDIPLLAAARKRHALALAAQKEFAQIKKFADKLREDPHDPEANLEIGKHLCLQRGNWDKGLPLLAKGSDEELKHLAEQDLAPSEDPKEQAKLADAWAKLAEAEKGNARAQLLTRAYFWYQQALPGLSGLSKNRVEKRVAALIEELPPELRGGDVLGEVRRFSNPFGPLYTVALSPDARLAATGGNDGTVRLWEVSSGKELRKFPGNPGQYLWALAFSPNGKLLASGGLARVIHIWDAATGKKLMQLNGHSNTVRAVAFLPDGKQLLSCSDDTSIRLWNVETGKQVRKFTGHTNYVMSAVVSRDGHKVLSGGFDNTVKLWDLDTGKELLTMQGHTAPVYGVALSPDGRRAMSVGTDQTARLWDTTTGKEVRRFEGNVGQLYCVAFAPNGRRALTGGQDGRVRLWDVNTGKELALDTQAGPSVWQVVYSADGRLALSAHQDSTARLWGRPKGK
jgi:hypothetical protein